MPDELHLDLDALSDFLVDGAGQPLTITVPEPLKPANARLMAFLGVRVEVRPVSDQALDRVRRPDAMRVRTMGQYDVGYELAGRKPGTPDWIDFRASVGRAERRLAAGEMVARCWSCKTELDVDVPVHSPRCRTLGRPSTSSDGRDALDAMDAGVPQRELDVQAVVETRDCATPRCDREADSGSDFCRVCDEGLRLQAERAGHVTTPIDAFAERSRDTKPEQEVETVRAPQRGWTREGILLSIQIFHSENGRTPKADEWIKAAPDHPTTSTVVKHLGSWSNAIEAAGFDRPTRGGARGNANAVKGSSVREPKAREAIGQSSPVVSSSPPLPEGDAAVPAESPSPAPTEAEAGSRTDEYTAWLASKIDVDQLKVERDELERQAVDCQRKAEALGSIIAAVKQLEDMEAG